MGFRKLVQMFACQQCNAIEVEQLFIADEDTHRNEILQRGVQSFPMAPSVESKRFLGNDGLIMRRQDFGNHRHTFYFLLPGFSIQVLAVDRKYPDTFDIYPHVSMPEIIQLSVHQQGAADEGAADEQLEYQTAFA